MSYVCVECERGSRYSFVIISVDKPNGDRPNAPNILVVVTDGQSNDQTATLQQATELHNLGVNVLAVGVGDSVDQTELAGIASSAQNVYTVSNFDALDTLDAALERTACAVTTPPPCEWCHHSCGLIMTLE